MINILMIVPDKHDATSMYRSWGVFPFLRDKIDINLVEAQEISWPVLAGTDLCFMQRPFKEDHLRVCRMVKDYGIPLWVDFDDMTWEIHPSNSVYRYYLATGGGKASKEAIRMADVVTVSTVALKQECDKMNGNVVVIPNAINDYWFPMTEFGERKDIIVWRGSSTHDYDWDSVMDEWGSILMNVGHFCTVCFIGAPNWKAVDLAKKLAANVIEEPGLEYVKYMAYLHKLSAKVLIHPLAPIRFNDCKSNAAWLESGAVGTLAVGPHGNEWRHAYTYRQGGFESAVIAALSSDSHMANQSVVYDQYSLSKINSKRLGVIHSLVGS